MSDGGKKSESGPETDTAQGKRPLTPAARRALEEAEERRRAGNAQGTKAPREVGGRKGLEPARYGDWEKDGIASDF